MIKRRTFLAGLLGAAALFPVGGSDISMARSHGAIVPLSAVVPSVRRAVPGRIMSAELRGDTYYIRVLTRAGRVVEVRADGHTGELIGVDGR